MEGGKASIDVQVDIVNNRNKSREHQPMNRQQLINIFSKSLHEVDERNINKSFGLTGLMA